ncbi:5-methyltetrahydropteroyltriglutamate--homocysteine S-methyltransferase [Pediococcus ethanolidurans]|uniref:5-methyltetrahydropteroyltriglutamate--homocysteine methyltransferase n=1 Tax=Pediococcus ethanolidurans TaxID=319653 RepID=A0A0R2K0Q0_9LACO|nr:5-methyltetrahydropteroyltriglutamate--homocysteine S-methyltransferase [Pediococcus ethanolidurans]KRN83200.1 5-methyltetrahydropteroyltriglutamate--homocysteine S-methyltransferase [Pediococcus ethanolidurans]GEN95793.1 5-methyltetrahydropteroyltriglutamate--homocysteine methyltransferase [Pediococcus ethanolidurans]SER32477.1 methionine synthase (B12-independent) [Pediococcus ethanolidurans]
MTTSIIGFPRIGEHRELKFATEHYWKKRATKEELLKTAQQLKAQRWDKQQKAGIDLIPVGDFSFFDTTLDAAYLFNVIPARYKQLGLSSLDEYFALARGYQSETESVKALPMKKWFNTNYHYIVPEFDDETDVKLTGSKLFDEINEAKKHGIQNPKAVIVGPYTLLKLSIFKGDKQPQDFASSLVNAYQDLLAKLNEQDVKWLQLDEPALSFDQSETDLALFTKIYESLLPAKKAVKVLLQTYFGDVRDSYQTLIKLPFDGIGLDLVATTENSKLIKENGFPTDKVLFAGVVNGKNIWRNHYVTTIETLKALNVKGEIVLSSSCSLQHVPYDASLETKLPKTVQQHLAFAYQKLDELVELDAIFQGHDQKVLAINNELFSTIKHPENSQVKSRIAQLTAADYTRLPERSKREQIQKQVFNLPELPTTTIGSFPQTKDVRQNRSKLRKGEITQAEYDAFNQAKIKRIIEFQEKIGVDVLVHGEYERNDMVEYFGEKLDGFVFTQNGWVQSYGTRGVKPPIIWGDVSRNEPITVDTTVFANKLTDRLVKGMLTGPVTIFNWSFPREDITPEQSVTQIALAIRDEVLDLEAHDIKIIQIDEPALRENLPLRKSDWYRAYLDWAVPAFRLVHSGVKPETQIHTHMCYSEFGDIIQAIDNLDADVISFEASRSDLSLIDQLVAANFQTEVGPGVYDIHSPRIPSVEELEEIINHIIAKLPAAKVWINPDCGLKTRSEKEAFDAVSNMVEATKKVRSSLYETNRSL